MTFSSNQYNMCTQIHTCKQRLLRRQCDVASLWYFNTIISHQLKYLTFIYNVSSSVMNWKNVVFEVNIRINKLWNWHCSHESATIISFSNIRYIQAPPQYQKHSYISRPDYIMLQNMHLCASLFICIYVCLYCNACATLLWLRLSANTSQTSHVGLLKHLCVCLCCELQLKHYTRLSTAVHMEHALVQGKTPQVKEIQNRINRCYYPFPVD